MCFKYFNQNRSSFSSITNLINALLEILKSHKFSIQPSRLRPLFPCRHARGLMFLQPPWISLNRLFQRAVRKLLSNYNFIHWQRFGAPDLWRRPKSVNDCHWLLSIGGESASMNRSLRLIKPQPRPGIKRGIKLSLNPSGAENITLCRCTGETL